jgi:hypothetical protein
MSEALVQRRQRSAAQPETTARAARLSPSARKLLLTAHVSLSVGWFGVVAAMLVLALSAAGASNPASAQAFSLALARVLDILILPPPASLSVAAILTGLALALGTRWGLFHHWWIVAKLVLSAAVLLTGLRFVQAWAQQAAASPPTAEARTLLIAASLAHLIMLGAATVISIYKPWGRIRRTRPGPESSV